MQVESHLSSTQQAGPNGPSSLPCARSIAIVDDSMLTRSLLTKYLSDQTDIHSVGCYGSVTDLFKLLQTESLDCLVVSLRKQSSIEEAAWLQFAERFPDCWVIVANHPSNDLTQLEQVFAGRFQLYRCEADARASVLAQQITKQIKLCLTAIRPSVTRSVPSVQSVTKRVEESLESTRLGPAAIELATINHNRTSKSTSYTPLSSRTAKGLPTRLIVIGGSTGAPAAVTKLLQQLPADFPLPIAVALHMLEDFTSRLAQSLDRATKLRCLEASDNELMLPATVYIARGDHHLTIEKNAQGRFATRLNKEPPEHFARPSVNQLFRSAAIAAGPATVAVILTGIGCDGLEGCEALVRRGGLVLAQDQASSTVWGMPAAVIQAGLAKEICSPGEAGQFIARKISLDAKRQQG